MSTPGPRPKYFTRMSPPDKDEMPPLPLTAENAPYQVFCLICEKAMTLNWRNPVLYFCYYCKDWYDAELKKYR
jgi:hypothetical protein